MGLKRILDRANRERERRTHRINDELRNEYERLLPYHEKAKQTKRRRRRDISPKTPIPEFISYQAPRQPGMKAGQKIHPEDWAAIKKLFDQGLTYADIGIYFDVSGTRICKGLKKRGLWTPRQVPRRENG